MLKTSKIFLEPITAFGRRSNEKPQSCIWEFNVLRCERGKERRKDLGIGRVGEKEVQRQMLKSRGRS